jgi:probable phosphoglycerate mutase
MNAVVAYIDGGSRGNPGPAGFGVRIEDHEGRVIAELNGALGVATNNVAEYRGLLAALAFLVRDEHRVVRIRSDSELLVKQMRGEYRVKHPGLVPLHREASALVSRLHKVTFEHIPREENGEADRLANLAIDEGSPIL